jgi:hypothetical protein
LKATAIAPMIWRGTSRELGALILGLFEKGLIKANSPTDALTQIEKHFILEDTGKPLNSKSTWQSLKNKTVLKQRPEVRQNPAQPDSLSVDPSARSMGAAY